VWVGDSFDVGNAGKARSQGLEFDTAWLLTERLRVNAAFIWLDARYIENRDNLCSIPQRFFPNPVPGCVFTPADTTATPPRPASYLQDLSGERFSPTFQGNVGVQYTQPLWSDIEAMLRADLTYTSEQRNPPDPTIAQGSRTLVDVGVTVRPSGRDSWSVGLLLQNATDREYYWYEFEAPAQVGTRIGFPVPPRRLTLQTRYHF
jgi:iron complex outermembrane receptor protein